MRIVTWNCNMAFHRKLPALMELKPDIAIVPECAAPEILNVKSPLAATISKVWLTHKKHKGLAVFSFGEYSIKRHEPFLEDIHCMLPIEVTGPMQFHILAVWDFWYSMSGEGPLLQALNRYRKFLTSVPALVVGDFNNHSVWDNPGKINNHANSVKALSELGLVSAYHSFNNIDGGKEAEPTLYWRDRTKDGLTYHVDYCFIPNSWTKRLTRVTVGSFDSWIKFSDHMPLIVDIES